MTRKSTKSALLMSSISLFICFAMLLGTTFAWFTDSVTSSGNIITSGTLDVEMYYADGKEAPASASWTDASTGAIFNYDLWEPGYVDVKHIKIANEGSLALKYEIAIVANGTVSKLSDVIDVYYVDPAVQVGNRADLSESAKIGTLTEVLAAMPESARGELAAEEIHTITLALKMQEEAGNEYQELSIGTDFKVVLSATQLNAESDSFGSDYDKDLETSDDGISKVLSDGTSVFYYNEESGYEGVVELAAIPENIGSEYTIPAEVNDLGNALVGVTLDKLTVPANVQYAYKALEGAVIDEVVLESGMTTIPDRMFYKANVEKVVIPSSVTTIETNAFAQATCKELTIPASVTTLGDVAFGYMKELETVYIESGAALPHYAFRACPKLSTVIFKGDVNIGTTSMIFSNYETGGKDDMTFYVTSDENAEKLKACLGTYNDTAVGKDRNKWTIIVGIPNV